MQGAVAPFPCFRPVMSCYLRQLARTRGGGLSPISCSKPMAYAKTAGGGLWPHACFSPVIYRRSASVGWAKARSAAPTHRRNKANGLNVATPITLRKPTHHDAASTRNVSAGHTWSNPRSRLSQSSGLLRVALVQSQRGHECRRPAGRNVGALFMSEDGLHRLRPGRSRCAAGLVAAYEQAAVVNPSRHTHWLSPECSDANDPTGHGSLAIDTPDCWP